MKYYWDNEDSCVCKTDGKKWWVYDNDDHCFYDESPLAMEIHNNQYPLIQITEGEALLKLI